VKKYSRPSCSPGLGARVVVEMETIHSGLRARNALTRLDFPAPDGAAIMSSLPSFKILNLLSDLLDQ